MNDELKELLELTRENNTMLKRVCAWLDKTESAEYQTNADMRDFAINCVANLLMSQRIGDSNQNGRL